MECARLIRFRGSSQSTLAEFGAALDLSPVGEGGWPQMQQCPNQAAGGFQPVHLLPNLFQSRVPLLDDFVWLWQRDSSSNLATILAQLLRCAYHSDCSSFQWVGPYLRSDLAFSGQAAGHFLLQTLCVKFHGIDILTKPRHTHPTRIVLGLRVLWIGCYNP